MKAPIDSMLERVEWLPAETPVGQGADNSLPHATHAGVLRIGDMELRCYRLNDGRAIINAEDMESFFGLMMNPGSMEGDE